MNEGVCVCMFQTNVKYLPSMCRLFHPMSSVFLSNRVSQLVSYLYILRIQEVKNSPTDLSSLEGLPEYASEVGTCYFFPGSLIAKLLFCTHGSLSLNRYFLGFQGSLTAKSLIKKQGFAIVNLPFLDHGSLSLNR